MLVRNMAAAPEAVGQARGSGGAGGGTQANFTTNVSPAKASRRYTTQLNWR